MIRSGSNVRRLRVENRSLLRGGALISTRSRRSQGRSARLLRRWIRSLPPTGRPDQETIELRGFDRAAHRRTFEKPISGSVGKGCRGRSSGTHDLEFPSAIPGGSGRPGPEGSHRDVRAAGAGGPEERGEPPDTPITTSAECDTSAGLASLRKPSRPDIAAPSHTDSPWVPASLTPRAATDTTTRRYTPAAAMRGAGSTGRM